MRRSPWALSLSCLFTLILVAAFVGCGGEDDPAQPDPSTGALAIDVIGLPAGTDCSILISGPDGFSAEASGDATLGGLAPGTYGVSVNSPVDGYTVYQPDVGAHTVQIEAAATSELTIEYGGTIARGHLQVDLGGLPVDVEGSVLVTGPNNFTRTLTGSQTFESLVPGRYELTATAVADAGSFYVPNALSVDVDVIAGQTVVNEVLYVAQEIGDLDFAITGVEFIQSIQRDTGDVPLIRSRDALLRIYLEGTESSPFVPDLQVELTVNGDVVFDEIIEPDYSMIPTTAVRGDLATTVNYRIAGQWIQPTLAVRVTIDPSSEIPEMDETDNVYPATGEPQAVAVASVDPYGITLVAVHQSINGLTGDLDASNQDDYVNMAQAMYPVPGVTVTLREGFTTDAPPLQSNDGNGAWNQILNEVNALKALDESGDNYFGVVPTTYNSGIAGLGYIPFSRDSNYRTAIGWDKRNSRNGVAAHELGHNLGLAHAPCGGASGTDSEYPHPNALIGHWGYDPRDGDLVDPSSTKDIMSYCNPQWISDYNFELVLDFLGAEITPRVIDDTPQPCLLVWGREVDGELVLDPSVVVNARPQLPETPGDHRVDVLDERGAPIAGLSFDMPRVGCSETGDGSFVWLVPIDALEGQRVGTVVVSGRGGTAVQQARTADAGAMRRLPMALDRTGPGRASLRWDATSLPLAIVRDARDGTVIAIGRHGDFDFACEPSRVDVVFSDGARTLDWSHTLD